MPEKTAQCTFTLSMDVPPFAGLVDCRLRTPILFRIGHNAMQNADVTLVAESAEGIITRLEKKLTVPGGSILRLSADDLFSPTRLAEGGLRRAAVCARLFAGGKEVARAERELTVLPYGHWEGLAGNAERLAAFVRPFSAESKRVLAIASQLEKRRNGVEICGYAGDKTAVGRALFSVFSAVRACAPAHGESADLTRPLPVTFGGAGPANALGAGLWACSALEAAGLHPVLAVGKERVGVGVWLYDSSFLTPSTDDAASVRAYAGEGDNLAFFDADDLFPDRKATFSQSSKRFFHALEGGAFTCFVDIFGCRRAGIAAEEGEGPVVLPHPPDRCGAWERRLVDLTARNPLLRFTGKNSLRVACTDADELLFALGTPNGLRLTAGGAPAEEERERTLDALERARGFLRVYAEEDEMAAVASRMMKTARAAEEETGAGVLYLSFGQLVYPAGSKETRSAPVALLAVSLTRGADGLYVRAGVGGFFYNFTLAEYLGGRYGQKFSCLGDPPATLRAAFAAVRAAINGMEGWSLREEAHLAVFAVHGHAIWNDLKRNLAAFSQNKLVRALLGGKADGTLFSGEGAPVGAPVTLLPSDSSQDEAIALSDTGASFVLHGPPGTGKSQTIANIIANALWRGKRVLFVAEKQAALEVVQRRLEGVGLGDFCLTLLSGRTKRADVAQKILHTLSLPPLEAPPSAAGGELAALERELAAPVAALHRAGRLGTPHGAILSVLGRADAPALNGSPAFYGALTEADLPACRHALSAAAAAYEGCRGVRGAPFEDVDLPAYGEGVRDAVACACGTLLAACAHLERMLSLFLSFYRQRMACRTEERLQAAVRLAARLEAGEDGPLFAHAAAEEIVAFSAANERLDERLAFFSRPFRALPLGEDREALARFAREGGDWRLSEPLRAAAGRLARLAREPIEEADFPKYLKTLSEIYEDRAIIEAFDPPAPSHNGRAGKRRGKGRESCWEKLKSLRALCREAFSDFDEEGFTVVCVRAAGGSALPLLRGFCTAAEEFREAREAFLRATGGRGERDGGDVVKRSAERAAAILDNIDLLRGWCRYRERVRSLENEGMGCVSALIKGGVGEKKLIAAFEKEAYRRYAEECILTRPELTRFGEKEFGACAARCRTLAEGARMEQRAQVRAALLSRLPRGEESAEERGVLMRAVRGRERGGVRGLLASVPLLFRAACPCVLASPISVAQDLEGEREGFDLVVFDEASQMTSAEAAGSIARAKAAIVVGDPNQLPPTRFFEGGEEGEDCESVLDEFLALGMPERKLRWHYRSRHESLIAFSNAAYYDNSLYTVPSPEVGGSRVKLVRVNGTYDRGGSKRNRAEAEALAAEVIRRLCDPACAGESIGVVTFSAAQMEEIEGVLARELAARHLTERAYGGEEPLFVKNLENVQGDERDVILFSVCYGPDGEGKVSLNFGPLNRAGGWRRLNVAASRARKEMLVFASLSSADLDAGRSFSRGVKDLKAFLEFAETGKTLCFSGEPAASAGIGGCLAKELARCGYPCRLGVGASGFRADVAVLGGRDSAKYVLAVLTDDDGSLSVKDRLLREEALKKGGWAVAWLSCADFYANPKRETERIKGILDGLCGRKARARLARYERRYRYAGEVERETEAALFGRGEGEAVRARLREIVAREQPISRAFLKKRFFGGFGMAGSRRAAEKLDRIIDSCRFPHDFAMGVEYFYLNPRALSFDRFRTEGKNAVRQGAEDYTVYEVVSMIRGALEDDVALYPDDLGALFERTFRTRRAGGELAAFLLGCVKYGEEKGLFARAPSERITLR